MKLLNRNDLIYVSDEICSEPPESRWLKQISDAKQKPKFRFLKHYSSVLTAVNGCEFLITEIITPYGDELQEYELIEHLNNNYPEKTFDLYSSLNVSTHDTNAGTHHRMLVVINGAEKSAPLAFQDMSVPVDMFVLGLGEQQSKLGNDTTISVVKFDNSLLFVVYTGGMISYLIKEPFISLEHCKERLDRFITFLKADTFHKSHAPWKVMVFQEVLSELTCEQAEIERPFQKNISDLIIDGLHLFATTEFAQQLNVLSESDKQSSKNSRNVLNMVAGVQWAVIVAVLCVGALFYFNSKLVDEKNQLQKQADVYTSYVSQLDSTQQKAKALLKEVTRKKSQSLQKVSWSGVLNELAALLPKGSTIKSVRAATKNETKTFRFGLEVPSWDALTQFEQKAKSNIRFDSIELSGKKKTKKGSVSTVVILGVK